MGTELTLYTETSPIIFSGPNSEMRNTALVAGSLSLLLIAAFVWWFAPSWPWLAGYLGLAFLAALSVPVFYRLGGFTRADEIEWLEQREEQEHVEMQAELVNARKQLDRLAVPEGVRQVDVLRQLLDDYHAVVETRFRGKSKSPLAYLSAARRVQQQVIHNLNDVIATQYSLSSISRHDNKLVSRTHRDDSSSRDEYSSSRLDDTDASHDDTDHDDTGRFEHRRDRKGRNRRSDSRKRQQLESSPQTTPSDSAPKIPNERQTRLVNLEADQQQRMSTLLDDNQQLLDALTDTAVEVANIRTVSDYDRLDTLARLVSLAEIASNTGK